MFTEVFYLNLFNRCFAFSRFKWVAPSIHVENTGNHQSTEQGDKTVKGAFAEDSLVYVFYHRMCFTRLLKQLYFFIISLLFYYTFLFFGVKESF